MGIRKPVISAADARRMAEIRAAGGDVPDPQALEAEGSRDGAPAAVETVVTASIPPAEAPSAPTPAMPDPAAVEDRPGKAEAPDSAAPAEESAVPAVIAAEAADTNVIVAAPAAEPQRERRAARSPDSGQERRAPARTTVDLRKRMEAMADRRQVFLSAPLPASGISETFEILCRQYPPQKALQMILRKALDDYEDALEDGSFVKLPQDYEVDNAETEEAIVQTSRMIPKPLIEVARDHFDPLGLESARAFGRKIGTAALAAFFAHEARRRVGRK